MRQDIWLAFRRIRLRPLSSALIAATLGLGIGASLAVFSVVDAVLLRPLRYDDAERLVRITQTIPVAGLPELSFSDIGFRRLQADNRSFDAVAAYTTRDANLLAGDVPRRLILAQVTSSLFDVLGIRPALGRRFTDAEDIPGAGRVVVLSNHLWRSSFRADPAIVGQVVRLEGEPFTVIGVLDPAVSFLSRDVAAWEPLRLDPAAVNPYRNSYAVVGKLRAGVSPDEARRDLTAIVRAVGREYPGPHGGSALDQAGYLANLRSLADDVTGDARPVVVLLLAGVLMLLVLTCANVANLQLAGMIMRAEELAVRAALGATRLSLMRSALVEGVVLTGCGAVLGLILAASGARLLIALMPPGIVIDSSLFSGRLLLVATGTILLIGAAIGAVPVAVVAGRDPAGGLRERGNGGSPRGANRVRRLLAGAQVALAILLLHGAGLLIASARAVQDIPLGFRPEGTISLRINLPEATLRDRSARETLLRRLVAESSQLPGVTAAGLANALPLTPGRQDLAMAVEGRPFKADGTDPLADYRVVSQGYFAAMGVALVQGRIFTDDDATERNTPLVISQSLARRLFADSADPIGQRLRFGPNAPWMPIVGVVADAKNRSLTDAARPELYVPALGTFANLALRTEITLVVRSQADAAALATPIRRIISSIAPDVATYAVASLTDIVDGARARMTTATMLMTGYAAAALLLAMAGTYGVLAYLVTQRRRELAIRMALGATPRDIVAMVGRESAMLVGVGAVVGLVAAAASGRLLSNLLYGVGVLDIRVALGVIACAGVVGVLAALVPARRATRLDPSAALKAGG
jgi:predicted permease